LRRRAFVSLVLAFGLAVRILLAWKWGPTGDNASFEAAANDLREYGFHFYSHVNAEDRDYSYPPGYLPVLLVAHWLTTPLAVVGLQFHQIVRVVPVVVDIVLAWIVQANLPPKRYLLRGMAAGAIALGPSFIVSSAMEAQLDAVAILPAVVAALLWQKKVARRALWCGLLIGIGVSIKVTPALLILALLPTAVSVRESLRLLTGAVVVPAISLAPFAIADWTGTAATLRYAGYPGAGAISLLVQPGLGEHYVGDYEFSSAYPLLQQWGWVLTVAAVACGAAVCFRARLAAVPSAAVLWLVVYATSMNWFPQYMAWGLPFLLMSGFVVPVVVAELIIAPTLALAYTGGLGLWHPPIRWSGLLYAALMDVLWCAAAASAFVLLRRLSISPRDGLGMRHSPANLCQDPLV
jgi:hypothetical protein